MRRTWLLFVGLTVVGFAVLVVLAGGIAGPRSERPEPVVEKDRSTRSGKGVSLDEFAPGVEVDAAYKFAWIYPWEVLDWTDPVTGTTVRLTSLNKWRFQAQSFEPFEGSENASVVFKHVVLRTYRLPKTLEEARAVERGDVAGIEALVKLRVTSEEARAETLSQHFRPGQRPSGPKRVGPIHLVGKVHIEDVEQGLEIDGSDVTIEPDKHTAIGEGLFEVRHAAYRIRGKGLSLHHEGDAQSAVQRDRVEILRDVQLFLSGNMEGGNEFAIDLADTEECPCEVQGPGGAVVVRETTPTADRLHLQMKTRMRASQSGGRGIEADRLDLIAFRPAGAGAPEDARAGAPDDLWKQGGWKLERVEADGNVVGTYRGVNDEGDSFIASMNAGHLVHEGRAGVTILEGDPDLRVIGRMPFEGADAEDGTLRFTCRDQAKVEPAPPTDVPAGADPARYRRVTLRGAARIERDQAGTTLQRDLLEGDEIVILLVSRKRVPAPASGSPNETLAISFAANGNVRVGGTRMTGACDRLVVTGLDTEQPRLVASAYEGRSQTFTFTELAHLGGPFGMHSEPAGKPGTRGSEGARGDEASGSGSRAQWLLDRFQARGGVDGSFAFGGPAIGLPAHVQGESVAYDRISDVARLQSGSAGAARVEILGIDGKPRDVVEAGHIEVERMRGFVRAGGGVYGRVFPDDLNLLADRGFAKTERAAPQAISLTAEGTIELRMDRRGTGKAPGEGAEQTLRVGGPLRIELRGTNGAVDRMRADGLEAVMIRAPRRPSPGVAPVAARHAPRATRERTGGATKRKAPSSPWELRASDLSLSFAGGDVSSFEAAGGVTVESGEASVRGDILSYDARTQLLTVRMRGRGRATALFGQGGARNLVEAPEIGVTLRDEGPGAVRARGPVHAVLYRVDPKGGGRLERYEVLGKGDIEVDDARILTHEWAEIRSSSRTAANGPWDLAWTLWSERVTVTGRSLLGGEGAEILRLEAEGPKTAFIAGQGKSRAAVWGDHFEIDMATNRATVTGTPERLVQTLLGPEGGSQTAAEFPKAIIDIVRGTLVFWDAPRVVLPREDR